MARNGNMTIISPASDNAILASAQSSLASVLAHENAKNPEAMINLTLSVWTMKRLLAMAERGRRNRH